MKANGVRGFILKKLNGGFFFRIYDEEDKRKFNDYKITANDIKVEIVDDYVEFRDGKLDYTLEALGRS